jgi:hypothetical protein
VYKCYKGDISKAAGFWDARNSDYFKPCCGMTEYYVASGIAVTGAGTQNTTAALTPSGSGSGSARVSPTAWALFLSALLCLLTIF